MPERASFDEAGSPRLCFDSHQDALDHASGVVKKANARLAAHRLGFIENYSKGNIEITFKAAPVWDSRAVKFVLSAIPFERQIIRTDADFLRTEESWCQGNIDKSTMLTSITYFIDSPKAFVPSEVRLEGHANIKDICGNIGMSVLGPAQPGLMIGFGSSKGKVSAWDFRPLSFGNCASISGTIQCRTKVGSGIKKNVGESSWQWVEFIYEILRAIRIWLSDSLIAYWVETAPLSSFEGRDMLSCA